MWYWYTYNKLVWYCGHWILDKVLERMAISQLDSGGCEMNEEFLSRRSKNRAFITHHSITQLPLPHAQCDVMQLFFTVFSR